MPTDSRICNNNNNNNNNNNKINKVVCVALWQYVGQIHPSSIMI